ncbi:MAG: hypothetical protein ACKVPX_01135 [Myxococcaceae bacterium]
MGFGFWRSLLGVTLSACALGCASASSLQRAKTLGVDNAEASLEVGAAFSVPLPSPDDFRAAPRSDFALRYGVADRVDVGGRIGSTGAEFGVKLLLSSPRSAFVHLSLLPTIGGLAVFGTAGPGGAFISQLPLLLGFEVLPGTELVLGVRAVDAVLFGALANGPSAGHVLFLGGSLGLSWRLSDHLRLHPELAALAPIWGASSAGAGPSFTYDGLWMQAAVGVQFDS